MIDYVHDSALWQNASNRDRVLVAHEVEEYIYERLYSSLFRPEKEQEKDARIERKEKRKSESCVLCMCMLNERETVMFSIIQMLQSFC